MAALVVGNKVIIKTTSGKRAAISNVTNPIIGNLATPGGYYQTQGGGSGWPIAVVTITYNGIDDVYLSGNSAVWASILWSGGGSMSWRIDGVTSSQDIPQGASQASLRVIATRSIPAATYTLRIDGWVPAWQSLTWPAIYVLKSSPIGGGQRVEILRTVSGRDLIAPVSEVMVGDLVTTVPNLASLDTPIGAGSAIRIRDQYKIYYGNGFMCYGTLCHMNHQWGFSWNGNGKVYAMSDFCLGNIPVAVSGYNVAYHLYINDVECAFVSDPITGGRIYDITPYCYIGWNVGSSNVLSGNGNTMNSPPIVMGYTSVQTTADFVIQTWYGSVNYESGQPIGGETHIWKHFQSGGGSWSPCPWLWGELHVPAAFTTARLSHDYRTFTPINVWDQLEIIFNETDSHIWNGMPISENIDVRAWLTNDGYNRMRIYCRNMQSDKRYCDALYLWIHK